MHPETARAGIAAEAGMFGKDNLDRLEALGCRFVVDARLRDLPKVLSGRVLDVSRYRSIHGSDPEGRRLPSRWPPPGGVVEREARPQGRP